MLTITKRRSVMMGQRKKGFDVKVPPSAMICELGPDICLKSLNFNINLWWGLALVAFGGAMLALAVMFAEKPVESGEKPEGDQ